MEKGYVVTVSTVIDAPPFKVWDALTNPVLIKQYMFGTNTESDWKIGSPIRWRGAWEGKTYEDRGKVLEAVPGKRLVYTYWSSMSGLLDSPENYKTITCTIEEFEGGTKLTISQDNNATEEQKKHSEQNWAMVSDRLKLVCEK